MPDAGNVRCRVPSGTAEGMGAALIAPVVALVVLGLIGAVYFTRAASRRRRAEETLPDEPYARRAEEIRRLRAEHAESDPARVSHPARRP
jgi:Tfp pilus assembly protein PilX